MAQTLFKKITNCIRYHLFSQRTLQRKLSTAKLRRLLLRWRWVLVVGILFLLLVSIVFEPQTVDYISDVNQACVIPTLDPWDPLIRQFVWDLKPLQCGKTAMILYMDDTGTIQYNVSALQKLGIQKSSVKCLYKTLLHEPYDDHVTYTSAVPFNPPLQVDADFFHVSCETNDNKQMLDKVFAGVKRPSHHKASNLQEESKDQLSVLLLTIDSVSRSQSIRKLPKTVKYLKEQLKAYDFEGFMNVGSGTFQNLVPLLTGRRGWSSELPILNYATEPFDVYPFIWKNFSQHGYTTMFAEDFVRAGTFHYELKGFREQPTDHYMYSYWKAVDAVSSHTYINYVFEMLEESNVYLKPTSPLCYGGEAKHVITIDYVKHFFRTYKGVRKFAFPFIGELSHDFNNLIGLTDDDFLSFLEWMKSEGHLDNTMLLFFSDHGTRIDKIRNTDVGRIEHRMPMLYIVIPDHIKASYPDLAKSMETNTKRLCTTYDLHQTLMDVMSQNLGKPSELYVEGSLRGISIFQPLPPHRSCKDAAIPEDVCICYASQPVNTTQDQSVSSVASIIVEIINSRVSTEPSCAKLKLFKIQEARLISQPLKETGEEKTGVSFYKYFKQETKPPRRYFIVIETIPGHAVFEANVDFNSFTESVSLVGDIDRVNRYGNQSSCINVRSLKPLCYCVVPNVNHKR